MRIVHYGGLGHFVDEVDLGSSLRVPHSTLVFLSNSLASSDIPLGIRVLESTHSTKVIDETYSALTFRLDEKIAFGCGKT